MLVKPRLTDEENMLALVTDAHLTSSVAGLRGLGRAGIRTFAMGPNRSAAGLWSRHTARRAVAPDVLNEPVAFVDEVLRSAGSADEAVVIYPGREESIDALVSATSSMPPNVRLPYPAGGALDLLRDKRRLFSLAEDVGLGAPKTFVEATAGELLRLSLTSFPCALKQAHPKRRSTLGRVRIFDSPEELNISLKKLPPDEPLLVQERLTGPLTALALVIGQQGRVFAHFRQVYSETWPMEAGMAVSSVSVAPDLDLVHRTTEMLTAAGYRGLAQLDFIADRNGRPLLIDCNPRFYQSLALALACGVNLPAAWHAATTDGDYQSDHQPDLRYRTGVNYRWLEADVSAFFHGKPGRLMRRAASPRVGAMWTADDPVPSLLLAWHAAKIRLAARMPARA
jgi:predicted ATP-grasp superfamily ATP-dependent carboligase